MPHIAALKRADSIARRERYKVRALFLAVLFLGTLAGFVLGYVHAISTLLDTVPVEIMGCPTWRTA